MWTSSGGRRRGLSRALAGALLAALVLPGCSGGDPDVSADPDGTPYATPNLPEDAAPPSPTTTPHGPRQPRKHADLPPVTADLATVLSATLQRRASAVTGGDRDAFLATLTSDDALRTSEGRYFDNLTQLPLLDLRYRLLPESLVRAGRGYWAVVELSMQLAGYDDLPVASLDRFRFAPAGATYRIASTTDKAWERENASVRQPWELEPIMARERSGVLGIFDRGTVDRAPQLMAAVTAGLADVSARVPYDWSRSAVFYALTDRRFLDSFQNLPGGDPEALDGVAFTVPAGPGDPTVAATRFVLSPTLMSRDARAAAPGRGGASTDALGRLVRHELTHLAVGPNDDRAPIWLTEGLAEWVSVQALPPERRRVPASVVAAVRRGVSEMPDAASFNDDQAAVHYALAWWVCEWLATTYGDDIPWAFLDAFASMRSTGSKASDDEVVEQVLGITPDQLARRGAAYLLQTYDRDPTQTATPGSPTSGPTSGPTSRPPTPSD